MPAASHTPKKKITQVELVRTEPDKILLPIERGEMASSADLTIEREVLHMQQQLSLVASKKALIVSRGGAMVVTDAAIASNDALIAELKEVTCKHQQKRALHTCGPLLEHDDILDRIFSFVGWKEWLYVGGVCRCWRSRYLSMCSKACAGEKEHAFQTSRRSSFVTAARFSMALANGLAMPDASQMYVFFDDLPVLSQQPIEVLRLARMRGTAWHENLCADAAYFGKFELLKWLHLSGCPWNALNVVANAIRGKRGQYKVILPWMLSKAEELSQQHKNELLVEAGGMYNIAALELLLQQGAEWPSSFLGEHELHEEPVRACWRYESVAWGTEQGLRLGCVALPRLRTRVVRCCRHPSRRCTPV
jgi:hypothetical protein